MKKLLALIIALSLALSLAACRGEEKPEVSPENENIATDIPASNTDDVSGKPADDEASDAKAETEDAEKEEEFTKLIENSMKFSKKSIQNFINIKLNNKEELTINDFDLSIKEEFIKLILTIIYESDSSSNYKINFLNKSINKNGISLQEFIIKRRDKHE